MGIDLFGVLGGINQFINIAIFDKIYTWIYNSIDNRVLNSQFKSLDNTTSGRIAFVLSLFSNGIRILILSISFVVIVFINIIIYIISNYHRWLMLGAVGVFALCLFVIFYLWDIIRNGINGTIIPGINEMIKGIAGKFVNPIVDGVSKIGVKIDRMDDRGIEGEVPSLPSIAKKIAIPLIELILSPLRADK
jgi:hypothetical protein